MMEHCWSCGARMPEDMYEFVPDWDGLCAECRRELTGKNSGKVTHERQGGERHG